jgi:nucleotide-binding universal stress UspA family protein
MHGVRGRASLAAGLLQARHCRVLALHVTKPAPRGLPGRILLPVGGHPYGLQAAGVWLQLLRPEVTHLQVLLVRRMGRQRLGDAQTRNESLRSGQEYCDRIERELCDRLQYGARVSESLAVVASDVAEAILVAAHRFAAGLILLGASQQSFYGRLVRGSPINEVMRRASCDVGVCGGWL